MVDKLDFDEIATLQKLGPRLPPIEKLDGWVVRRLLEIMQGKDPQINFRFREIQMPGGYRPHPPGSDWFEMRKTVSIQFRGTTDRKRSAHIFEDGSITWKKDKHDEDNQRMWRNQRLLAEESRYPVLKQTACRVQAYHSMILELRALRDNNEMSIEEKEADKALAMARYENVLAMQEQARRVLFQI